MKATYQIRAGDFEYIMIEEDVRDHIEAVGGYVLLKEAFIGPKQAPDSEFPVGVGLDAKEWRTALDGYITEGAMTAEEYERMSPFQQSVIQEIKKSSKRVNK